MKAQTIHLQRDPRKADYEAGKLAKRLRRLVGQAIADFDMIGDGDQVMVCLSGGKDSYAMLDVLLQPAGARRRSPSSSSRSTSTRSSPDFPEHVLPEYLEALGVPFRIERAGHLQRREARDPRGQDDVLAVLAAAARRALPRGGRARRTKIALGHHRDDILETFFLNLFYGGQLKAMPPKLRLRRRPARGDPPARLRATRRDLARLRASCAQFPIIPCNLCGSQENLQRKQIKAKCCGTGNASISGARRIHLPRARRVTPSHLLDRTRFDFTNMK